MTKRRKPTEHNKHSYKSLPLGGLRRYGGPKFNYFNKLKFPHYVKFTTGTNFEDYYLEPLRALSTFANLLSNNVLRRVTIHWWGIEGEYEGVTVMRASDKDFRRVPRWIVDALLENADVTLEYV